MSQTTRTIATVSHVEQKDNIISNGVIFNLDGSLHLKFRTDEEAIRYLSWFDAENDL
jgi:hypothetical protein